MEQETLVVLSKTDILRELITEQLTIAAQHIFAVVERTVAAYEDEASGLRQEVERQRRLLEAVEEPQIKVETTDEQLFPVCEPARAQEAEGRRGLPEDEEQHKHEPSLGFFCYTEKQLEARGDVNANPEGSAPIPTQDQQPLTNQDPETASRSEATFLSRLDTTALDQYRLRTTPQSDSKRVSRRRVSKPPDHVVFRIRILEDSEIDVLSLNVFKKYPLHELQCPFGLQETDFLDLLRSAFPQLAADKPFDIFLTGKSKRLQPLKVNALTPEEIYTTLKSNASVKSSLYIRLKAQEEPRAIDVMPNAPPGNEAVPYSPPISNPTRTHTGLSPDVPPAKRRRSSEPPPHIALRVRVLEDSNIDVIHCNVFKKYPLKELQFPLGLRETDFLDLLRCTFPQLAADEPFDLLTADKNRRLQPLIVSTLTPEEIYRTIKSSGAGQSSLYIRLKSPEDHPAKNNHFHFLKNKDFPSTSKRTKLKSRVLSKRRRPRRRPHRRKQIPKVFKIRLWKDSQTNALMSKGMDYTGKQLEGGEDVNDNSERPGLIPTQGQEPLAELDHETVFRFPPSVQADKLRPDRQKVPGESQRQIDFNIRILDHCEIDKLHINVFKKCPLYTLQCPSGLQETDFLDLLRSSFPELAAYESFDIFITDRSRILQPLSVNALTPENIYKTIKSNGAGKSSLYIRLKGKPVAQATDEALDLTRRKVATDNSQVISKPTRPQTGSLLSRIQPDVGNLSNCPDSIMMTHIDLRIRVLDPHINVLSSHVFKKYPPVVLQCPLGLQEAEFLDLLSSSCPQLAPNHPIEIFIVGQGRTLQPLKVKSLTPEEISRTMFPSKSSLYIRLKAQEEPQATHVELDASKRKEAAAGSLSISKQTGPNIRLSLRVQPNMEKLSRRRKKLPQPHINLKIRFLDDSRLNLLTWNMFYKFPFKKMKFPSGLQEKDFLNRLRHTFPRLYANEPFDLLIADKAKRLHLLKVSTLTPEEIYRAIRCNGYSSLYIRLKSPQDHQAEEKQKKDAAVKDSPSTSDETRLNPRVQSDWKNPKTLSSSEIQNHIDLRIRVLEDPKIEVLSSKVFRKCSVRRLRCPRGLHESDFLDLLKSTFPQLPADKSINIMTSDKSKRLYLLNLNTVTPEEIHKMVKLNSLSALYIQPKAKDEAQHSPGNQEQRNGDAAKYFPSTSDEQRLNSSIPVQQNEEHRATDLSVNLLHDTEVQHESSSLCIPPAEKEKDKDEVSDEDDDSEPDHRNEEDPTNGEFGTSTNKRVKSSNAKANGNEQISLPGRSNASLSCKVCRAVHVSKKMLIKHAWSHVDHPDRTCGVCGGGSETAEELRRHLQSHIKTQSCNVCGKSLLSVSDLKGHVARHKGAKTFPCKNCNVAFTEKSTLNNQKWAHAGVRPCKNDAGQKVHVSNMKLKSNTATHADKKLYSCSMCSKAFRKLETLSQHQANHISHAQVTAKMQLFQCQICGKGFHTDKKLQIHLKYHESKRQHICNICNKGFSGKAYLNIHMLVHADQSSTQKQQTEENVSQDTKMDAK